jgi:phosphatidylglycerol:prolipoprotein diacylglycerol transferase
MPFVIDIDPVAFTLVGIPVRWYGLIFVGAAALGIWLAQREGRRRGVGDEILSDAVIWVAVAALVGGRALYIIQNELGSIAADPFHAVMIWQGGLSFYGGLLAAIGALVIFARRRRLPFLLAADVAAPAAALGQAVGHFGCLISGDSYGTVTSLPWAVIYRNPGAMARLGVPLHPTQVYEAIGLGVLFVVLWRGRARLERLGSGALAGAYLVGLSAIRFGLFFLRDEAPVFLGLKTAQLIGLGIGALGLAILAVLVARQITDRRSILEVGRP